MIVWMDRKNIINVHKKKSIISEIRPEPSDCIVRKTHKFHFFSAKYCDQLYQMIFEDLSGSPL